MFDDLAAQFFEQVVVAYDRYMALRKGDTSGTSEHGLAAMSAASALSHFREHLRPNLKMTRAQAERACPDYELITDVTNVWKHGNLDLKRRKTLVKSAADIEEVTVVTGYEDADGDYIDAQTVVVANCTDGSRRHLDEALTNVLNFWGGELKRLGVIDYTPQLTYPRPGSTAVARLEARSANLTMLQGARKPRLHLLPQIP